MAQQFVTNPVAPSAQDNLDLLYTNLAENVAYRRAKQQMKGAQKQDLELKMAQGLIPKANITVTDEGFAFEGEDTLGSELLGTERRDTSAAREAFWRAVGAPERGADMSREGFTNVTEEQVPGQAEEFARITAAAKEGADTRFTPEQQELLDKDFAAASAMLGVVAGKAGTGPQPTPSPTPTPTPNPTPSPTPTPTPASAASTGSAVGGIGATTATAPPPPPPPTAASLGAIMAQKIASPSTTKAAPAPATPAGGTTPTGRTSNSQSTSNSISEMGQVEVGIERGGYEAQMANVATKTTQVQSAQIDEIKRSIPRLAGLAALETYGNQLMQTRGYNTGAPMQDTFSTLLNQRVKDIARWEEAATKSGVQQTLTELDPYKIDVKGSKANLKVTRKDQLAAKTTINTSTNVAGNTPAAQIQQANLPSTTAGQSTLISYDEQGRKLTGSVSGLAMRSTGALNFTDGKGLVNVLTVQKNRANKTGRGKYDIKILQQDAASGQPQMVQVETPSGPITLEYEAALQNSTYKDADGQTIKTHGWKVSAGSGMEISELERFTGHILNK